MYDYTLCMWCVRACVRVFLSVYKLVRFVSVRNSDRLGNGVLYASVNPEYFSAAESEWSMYVRNDCCCDWKHIHRLYQHLYIFFSVQCMYQMSGRWRGRRSPWVANLARGPSAWSTRAWRRAWSKMNQRPVSPLRPSTSQPAWGRE